MPTLPEPLFNEIVEICRPHFEDQSARRDFLASIWGKDWLKTVKIDWSLSSKEFSDQLISLLETSQLKILTSSFLAMTGRIGQVGDLHRRIDELHSPLENAVSVEQETQESPTGATINTDGGAAFIGDVVAKHGGTVIGGDLELIIQSFSKDTIQTLSSFWEDWQEQTNPSISARLIQAGRKTAVDNITEWLTNPADLLKLQAENSSEAIAFLGSVLETLDLEIGEGYKDSAFIISDRDMWDKLISISSGNLLIPRFDNPNIRKAIRAGNYVFIPLDKNIQTNDGIVLNRLIRSEAKDALIDMGLDEDGAFKLALIGRRSFQSLIRHLAISRELQQPEWSKGENANQVIPALLAGSWNNNNSGDQEILKDLTGTDYSAYERQLTNWKNATDSPVHLAGGVWMVTSKEDAWLLVSSSLTSWVMENFEAVCLRVLGDLDPRLDLDQDKRWASSFYGVNRPHSEYLRKGLADTLSFLGSLDSNLTFSNGLTAKQYAQRIVRSLLVKAYEDQTGETWVSISDVLPELAEAAPNVFIEYIERALQDQTEFAKRFSNEEGDVIFSPSYHSGLLWALQILAWAPEHFGKVTLLLAKLNQLLSVRSGNNPSSSLQQIYLPWRPQTGANFAQRLEGIDLLRSFEGEEAWKLMIELVSSRRSISFNTFSPKYRVWKPADEIRVDNEEFHQFMNEIFDRLVVDVGVTGKRWVDLIKIFEQFAGSKQEMIIDHLETIEILDFPAEEKEKIRDSLREMIFRSRRFSDKEWAIKPTLLEKLEQILDSLVPEDVIERFVELFSFESPNYYDESFEWFKPNSLLSQYRQQTLNELLDDLDLEAILQLITIVDRPFELGQTLQRALKEIDYEESFLKKYFESDSTKDVDFIRGYSAARFRVEESGDWEWGMSLIEHEVKTWGSSAQVHFLESLIFDKKFFEILDGFGEETKQIYWNRFQRYGSMDISLVPKILNELIRFNRPLIALELLASYIDDGVQITTEQAAEILKLGLITEPGPDAPSQIFDYYVGKLLNYLNDSSDISIRELAQLEWLSLPLIQYMEYTPKALFSILSNDPSFFVELITLLFKPRSQKQPRNLTEFELNQAHNARELLDIWNLVPGSDGKNIDIEVLLNWIEEARKMLEDRDRLIVGEQYIGKLLRHSPIDEEGNWPHPKICEALEILANQEIERGIEMEVVNSRGVTSRLPGEGGKQERELAEKFLKSSEKYSVRYPRASAMLTRLSERYILEAKREDDDADLFLST